MEESLERIRNWMKESKFAEAEKAAAALILQTENPPLELLQLVASSILEQKKSPPTFLLLGLAEKELELDCEKSIYWLALISAEEGKRNYRQVQFLKIRMADLKGRVDELHDLLSGFQIYLFEKKIPAIPPLIHEMIEKYFRHDFSLRLQQLSLSLMLVDLEASEKILKNLFLSTVEKASARGIKNKIDAIAKILDATDFKGYLEVYRGLCTLMLEGTKGKTNVKKLVELVIFTNDFKFQVLVMHLMYKNGLDDLALDYAPVIRSHPDYDFVYFEKYYVHLKSFFTQARVKPSAILPKELNVDVSLTEKIQRTPALSALGDNRSEEESKIINLFKYQDYSEHDLFEIATSFIQSELPKVALMAVEKILSKAVTDRTFLKASYLKLTCLLLIGDNRAAVDCALTAIDRAKTKDDILSFLYGEAEAYIRLGLVKDAKIVLREIISIDSQYRLTRERLEKLDEI